MREVTTEEEEEERGEEEEGEEEDLSSYRQDHPAELRRRAGHHDRRLRGLHHRAPDRIERDRDTEDRYRGLGVQRDQHHHADCAGSPAR